MLTAAFHLVDPVHVEHDPLDAVEVGQNAPHGQLGGGEAQCSLQLPDPYRPPAAGEDVTLQRRAGPRRADDGAGRGPVGHRDCSVVRPHEVKLEPVGQLLADGDATDAVTALVQRWLNTPTPSFPARDG